MGSAHIFFEERRILPMSNFKKFVAVLMGVVMACVFATSAFAASTADKATAIKSEMANYGLTGFDAVIDSLDDTQLQVLIDNRGTLEQKASQVIAYKNDNHSAEDQVANLNSQLSSVQGILSQAGITATMSVSVNGTTVTAVPAAKTATATGSTKMYWSAAENDPEYQRNKVNFRHYFICMFKKADAGVVMTSGYKAEA